MAIILFLRVSDTLSIHNLIQLKRVSLQTFRHWVQLGQFWRILLKLGEIVKSLYERECLLLGAFQLRVMAVESLDH